MLKFYKKLFFITLYFNLSYFTGDAGLNGLTIHSRANCVNNETISWDAVDSHFLKTVSVHYLNGNFSHLNMTHFEETWRSAVVHWGEGTGGWTVIGLHYMMEDGESIFLGETFVSDCSIYNGWWDFNRE